MSNSSDLCNDTSFDYLIKSIIEDLFSYDTTRRKHILEYYFYKDATLHSPIMTTTGVNNIQYVHTVWQALNRREPTISNIVFDGHNTAVVHLIHNLSPRLLPSLVQLQVPAITTLYFRETECDNGGLLKIYRQEDSWTLEGLLQSVPLISFWYNNVLRVVMGKLLTTTGDILDSAIHHAEKMSVQGRSIQRYGHVLAADQMDRIQACESSIKKYFSHPNNHTTPSSSWKQLKQQEQLYLRQQQEDGEDEEDYHHTVLTPINKHLESFSYPDSLAEGKITLLTENASNSKYE